MKPGPNSNRRHLLALGIVAFTLTLVSWDRHQSPDGNGRQQVYNDTIPQKNRDRKVRDLDEAIQELDNVNLQAEMDRAMEEVKEAMKNIDYTKIRKDIDNALKEVDMDKIKVEVEQAMKNVDYDKIKMDIDRSMASIDWDKIKASVDQARNIDFGKLDADMKKMQEELKNVGPEVKKSLEKAKVEIEKAKAEMKEYKSFVDGLDHDGLINKKEPYSISHRDGKLVVNGKEVSAQVYQQYHSFLEKHPSFTIKKDKDDFDIDMD